MKRLIKRISFILFWQSLALLTVLLVNQEWYAAWFAGFVILFFLLLLLSGKIIPSKRDQDTLSRILNDYKSIIKLEDELHDESIKLEMTCPACEVKNNLWSFIEDYKCRKCGSDLWTSKAPDLGEKFEKALAKRNKIYNFYNKLGSKYRGKLKKFKMTGQA
jgi:hypothetical protein